MCGVYHILLIFFSRFCCWIDWPRLAIRMLELKLVYKRGIAGEMQTTTTMMMMDTFSQKLEETLQHTNH